MARREAINVASMVVGLGVPTVTPRTVKPAETGVSPIVYCTARILDYCQERGAS
jgi:hypothetical protein